MIANPTELRTDAPTSNRRLDATTIMRSAAEETGRSTHEPDELAHLVNGIGYLVRVHGYPITKPEGISQIDAGQ